MMLPGAAVAEMFFESMSVSSLRAMLEAIRHVDDAHDRPLRH
jgi:hypothetical protein